MQIMAYLNLRIVIRLLKLNTGIIYILYIFLVFIQKWNQYLKFSEYKWFFWLIIDSAMCK